VQAVLAAVGARQWELSNGAVGFEGEVSVKRDGVDSLESRWVSRKRGGQVQWAYLVNDL